MKTRFSVFAVYSVSITKSSYEVRHNVVDHFFSYKINETRTFYLERVPHDSVETEARRRGAASIR